MTHKGLSEDNLMEAFHLFDAELRYADDTTPVVPPDGSVARYRAWVATDDVPAALRSAA